MKVNVKFEMIVNTMSRLRCRLNSRALKSLRSGSGPLAIDQFKLKIEFNVKVTTEIYVKIKINFQLKVKVSVKVKVNSMQRLRSWLTL